VKLAITGASGYIGRRLVKQALALGHEVLVLCRQDPHMPGTQWQYYDLADSNPISVAGGTSHLIHLAAQTGASSIGTEAEVAAATRLIAAAQQAGSGFIFISSQTASAAAPTDYGKVKWQIEQQVLSSGGLVLRPGMVYGGIAQGLFGTLVAFVRQHLCIPLFLPAPRVQPVHVDDLCAAILACTQTATLRSRVFCIGSPELVTFTDFLQAIATHWLRVRRIRLPVPVFLLAWISALLSRAAQERTGLYRLTSLFSLPAMATRADLATLKIVLRPLHCGMTRCGNGRRRALLREAESLLTYVLRESPSFALVARYVRAIEHSRTAIALNLPSLLLAFPSLLALVDNDQHAELRWRLQAAVLLSEATPQGARRFLGPESSAGFLHALFRISMAVVKEACWRVASLLLRPFIHVDDSLPGPVHDH
jgi:nucleoside-diphosphate-sugar epimerase